jgi:radical SAM protein with 4Fe4S-binding SPASM domain
MIKTLKDKESNVTKFLQSKGDKDNFVKTLLADKQPQRTEIEVSFFQYCNFHCSFCWQDSKDDTGVDTIVEKADQVIKYISEWEDLKDDVYIAMTGGELFLDGVDRYYDYREFILKVNDYFSAKHPDKTLAFTFITNLSFTETGKVKAFMDNLRKEATVGLATSWDPTGRPFNTEIKSQFHENLLYLKEYIYGVTFVLTAPTINKLLRGDLSYLDFLYDNYVTDFDYYVPTDTSARLMPSDHEILNFLRMVHKRYPNMGLMEAWRLGESNPISCNSLNKITILPDGSLTTCRQVEYDKEDFSTDIEIDSNSNITYNYMEEKGCFSCEFYDKCTFSCFVMNDNKQYKKKKTLDDCLYRIFFKEIENDGKGKDTQNT